MKPISRSPRGSLRLGSASSPDYTTRGGHGWLFPTNTKWRDDKSGDRLDVDAKCFSQDLNRMTLHEDASWREAARANWPVFRSRRCT
jgi:hypothetical protein